MPKHDWKKPGALDSHLALARVPADTPEGRAALEGSIRSWLFQLESSKWPRALQYFENASYLMGNHLTRYYYTSDGGLGFHHFGSETGSGADNLVAKSADNRLIRPVETVVNMLTGTRPEPRVVPNSDQPEDEDAAELSELLIQLLWEKPLRLPEKLAEVAFAGCICSTQAIEIEYGETDIPIEVQRFKKVDTLNPLFVSESETPDEPRIIKTEVPADDFEVEFKRDFIARHWTFYHLMPDPAATCPDDMTWIARSSFEDIDWIADNFTRKPDDGPEWLFDDRDQLRDSIPTNNATRFSLYWWTKFRDVIESPQYYQHGGGLAPQTFTTSGGYAPNQTLFTVIDVKPTKEFPHGRTLILAGGTLIYAGEARSWSREYPWRWHPYAFWGWLKIPGRFWHIPLLSELVPLQKKINAIDQLVHANRQYMSLGQWWIPKQAKVAEGRISGIPGEHYVYTAAPGFPKPERVKNDPLPQELLIERDTLIRAIDFIAASGTLNDQIARSAARAGVILDFLRREKLESKGPMLANFERFLEVIAQNILIEAQLNIRAEDPELTQRLQVASRDHSSLTIESFTGASLRDHHSVRIDISSELRHTPEMRSQQALEFFQASQGNVTPEEREGVMAATGLDRFMKNAESATVRRIKRIIARVQQGHLDAAFPMPGLDDPNAAAKTLNRFLLGDKFHELEQKQKEILLQLHDHYAEEIARAQQQQLQMQIALAQAGIKSPQ